ncbi:(Fe-S)-binding protein [Nocardia sp. 348MFTsu5.1]|uniref:(Fe-S)-binding protein n=1 Tax=Nocardia sp. 348MFTsu5.1 TaxID=1172185 RepID=UPI00048C71D8|nr:(Fe-S)-binding protein [Nocardia sp. 348MFTsu5.1]
MNATTITLGTIGLLLSLVCWALFLRGVGRIFRTIMKGQPAPDRWRPFIPRFKTMVVEFIAHTRMNKFRTVGWAHWLVMIGFLLGSLLWFEAYGQTFNPEFHWPLFGDTFVWHLLDEILGLGTVIGILTLIIIRQLNHPRVPERLSRFGGSRFGAAYFVEIVVLLEGLGMIFVKAGKIATYGHSDPASDFFTMQVAKLLPASVVMVSIFAFIKLMSGMIWLAVVGLNITWGVAWHRFAAFFNIYFKREDDGGVALGAAKPMISGGKVLDMETADPDVDAFGAGKIEDFSWKGWLDFTTCTECGRCQSQCPAWNTGKPLSPKLLIMSLRDHGYAKAPYLLAGGKKDMGGDEVGLVDGDGNVKQDKLDAIPEAARLEAERKLVGESEGATGAVIDTETLWSCTTCGACVEQCPVDIEHVDHIIDMRRYQVLIESDFPTELAGLFKNLENKGNPWGQNSKDRTKWIDEMDIEIPVFGKDVESFEGFEYLFWVGCAGAYEDRAKKTTKAVAELLDIAAVDFLVLGEGETCTGDSARRAGNEFLFQMLAQQNIEMLGEVFATAPNQKKKIVVTCAHCFNALGNEYPQVGGTYEVVHHTQLLNRLVRDKRLIPVAEVNEDITYHDPCYLGRHNKVYDAPRELMAASGANLKEMPRHGERSMCCGAGGARMWMEETIGKRINVDRVDEALATNPKKVATGCPFCRVMLTDGVTAQIAGTEKEGQVEVVDVAQLILESVKRGAPEIKRGGRFLGAASLGLSAPTIEPDETKAPEPAKAAVATAAAATASTVTVDKPKIGGGLGIGGGAKKPGGAPKPGGGAPKPGGAAKKPGGLGIGGGAKKPGGGAPKPGGAKPAAAAAPAEAAATEAPAAETAAPAAKGLAIGGGAKRPGAPRPGGAAKKPGAAKPAAAAPTTEAAPAAPAAEAAPEETKPAAAPVKGLAIGGGAKRPGAPRPGGAAKKPGAAKPAEAAPAAEPEQPAESAPEEVVTEAVADTVTEAPKEPAVPVKGLAMGGAAKRPGAKRPGAPKPAAAAKPAEAAVETAEEPETPAVEEPEAPAVVAEAPAAVEPETAPAATGSTNSDGRTLAESGPTKAKGFGIAAGKKRPGKS